MLLGLSGVELHILDEFEDVEYTRSDVEVLLMVSHSLNLLLANCITNEANVTFPKFICMIILCSHKNYKIDCTGQV